MELKAKKEQRAKLITDLQELSGLVTVEKRAFTAEEKAKVIRMKADASQLADEIETLELTSGIDSIADVKETAQRSEYRETRPSVSDADKVLAFRGWLSQQWDGQPSEEQRVAAAKVGLNLGADRLSIRAQTVGTTTQGGFTVPAPAMGRLVEVMKAFGGMQDAVEVIHTAKGNGIDYPSVDDTANLAGRIGELDDTENTSVVFGNTEIRVGAYTSGVFPISREILADSAFDLEGLVTRKLGERLARAVSKDATTHASFVGLTNGLTADAFEFTEAGLTYADLITMKNKLDDAYDGEWMFSKDVLQEIELMVDEDGRPLWRPDLINGVPGKVVGSNYRINRDLDADTILYGDFKETYVMNAVGSPEVSVLRERYLIDQNAIAIVIWARYGGKVVNTASCKKFARDSGT